MRKRILIALPAVVLAAWWVATHWFAPKPRWVMSSNEGLISCRDAPALKVFPSERIETGEIPPITGPRAAQIALEVRGGLAADIGLAKATFPDGTEHTAWYLTTLTDNGGYTLIGKAEVLYVDATTGEPLLLITGVKISDPSMTCGLVDFQLVPYMLSGRFLSSNMLCGYLVVVGVVAGIMWLRHRR